MTNPFSLEGKIALVTGASYGIGFAIAKALANAGAKIVFNDIKQEFVDKGLAAYEAEGIEVKGYVCDVTDEEAVNAMVATIEKEVGVIDILVNNAGIIKRIPMHEMSAQEFRQVIDVDLNAPFICAKAVIPSMMKKGGGKIINICSTVVICNNLTVSSGLQSFNIKFEIWNFTYCTEYTIASNVLIFAFASNFKTVNKVFAQNFVNSSIENKLYIVFIHNSFNKIIGSSELIASMDKINLFAQCR